MPMARADAPLRSHRAPVPLLASAVFRPALRHQPAHPERSGAGRERGFPEGASARAIGIDPTTLRSAMRCSDRREPPLPAGAEAHHQAPAR